MLVAIWLTLCTGKGNVSMAGTWAQSRRSGRRIAPEPNKLTDIVEIRPNRILHIKRLNPKDRDEKFEKEMQSYLQYKESGLLLQSFPPSRGLVQSRGTSIGNTSVITDTSHQQKSSTNGTINSDIKEQHRSSANETVKSDLSYQKVGDTNRTAESITHSLPPELDDSEGGPKGLWITDALKSSSSSKLATSPSRLSTDSQGVHSVSNVQVSISRPVSNGNQLGKIGESSETSSIKNHRRDSFSKSAKSPRKTKDHRPVSGRSFRTNTISRTLSNGSSDIQEFDDTLHLNSPYRDVTLFFIHGVGGCADVWHAQMQFFANLGFEVVALDLIGHGYSCCPDSPRAYHFTEILEDIEAVFDKFCKKQNVIVGHSYGCAFAAALGRRRARRVSKLVLVSGGAPHPLAPQPGVFKMPVCLLSCIKPCLFSRFESNAFHANVKDSGLSKELAFDVPVYVLSHMMNGQDWIDGDTMYHRWLTMPTLLLHGKYDKFVTIEEELEMEKAIYNSVIKVIDNSSHMVMMEAPDQVNQLLYEFIFQSQLPESGRSTAMEIAKSMTSVRAKSARPKSSKQFA